MENQPTTNCKVSPEDLLAFVDGELSPKARKRVLAHVEECAACQQQTANLRRLSLDLSAVAFERAPKHLVDGAMTAILDDELPKYRRPPVVRQVFCWRTAAEFAVAAVVLFATLTIAVDRQETKLTGRSMVSALVGDAQKQHEIHSLSKAMVKAFDTKQPLATVRRNGFSAVIYDARVAKNGDIYMLTNFSFAGGTSPNIQDEYGNTFVPIRVDTWKGPNQLVWLTPLRPDEVVGPPHELNLVFAGRDLAALRGRGRSRIASFDFAGLELKAPRGEIDPNAMMARMLAGAGLDVETQKELARETRILAPHGSDALKQSF